MRQTMANILLRMGKAIPEGFLKPCHRRRAIAEESGAILPEAEDDVPAFLRRAI